MITFEQLKQKGYIIEVNTTGAMIVDTIDADDISLTSLQEATYTQKNIIYDDCDPDTLNISDTEAAKRTANDIRKIINIIEENSTKED